MSKKKKNKNKKKNRPRKIMTPLAGHKKIGKSLVPPILQLNGLNFSSWLNDRLPEMLWATLVITAIPRKKALEIFRDIATIGLRYRHSGQDQARNWTLRHSDLPNQPQELTNALIGRVLQCEMGLEALRPLLLFKNLPGITWWQEALPADPTEDDWQTLVQAVQRTTDHQSQEATDVRWVSILFKIALGELLFPQELEEKVLEIIEYPNRGDMRKVQPSIRSMEMTIASLHQSSWPESFWNFSLENTTCIPAPLFPRVTASGDVESIKQQVVEVRKALLEHWSRTLSTSGLDPKHDGVFGFGFFALSCLTEMVMAHLSQAISGRLLLRALTECRISLAYLARCGDESMWKSFRSYGIGQAKLALLKHEETTGEKPQFISLQTLEALANEDYFQEYVQIDLGHWGGKNLRWLAEKSGTKDDYDRYYGWASGFAHGQWGAMRDSNFTHCLNPLHRFHRIPLVSHRMLEATTEDALQLVNSLLDDVNFIYPGFNTRFEVKRISHEEKDEPLETT